MPNAPQNPSKLVGSKWTAVEVEGRRKHWLVVEYQKSTGSAVLEAVMDKQRLEIPWRQLRNRQAWRPGWT